MQTKRCLHCRIKFKGHGSKLYCTRECSRDKWLSENKDKIKASNLKYAKKISDSNLKLIQCHTCGEDVLSKRPRKYCSRKCNNKANSYKPTKKECITCKSDITSSKSKYCKDCKPKPKSYYKPKLKKDYSCKTCGKSFKAHMPNAKYCKQTCSPSHKASKKARKRGIRQARLKVETWGDIAEFIENRPEGCELDHIIPLNHPDVCGLHNTWNFQWLDSEDNSKKSNQFDGTPENISWKKLT